ncbi:preprotein translocase subunit SecE [Candidatus Uhrbacteria bacterium]|nr:preprotein translocase subunit SecE [Candidatus Uhrbacteria bacterium]
MTLANVRDKTFSYIKGSYLELRRVVWPTRQEIVQHTIIVIGLSIFVALFLGALDMIFQTGLEKLLFIVK